MNPRATPLRSSRAGSFSLVLLRALVLPRALALAVPLLLLGALVGCFAAPDRPDRPPGSAIWLEVSQEGADTVPASAVLNRLRDLGVGDLFLPFGRLVWESGSPGVVFPEAPRLPRRSAVTLVIEGSWDAVGEVAEEAGATLSQELQRAELEARSRGLLPTGIHLELSNSGEIPDLESLAEALEESRDGMSPELLLSVGISSAWLSGDEELSSVAAATDFLVAWLYGQRPEDLRRSGIEDHRWDLSQVDLALRQLEALETPYLVGVVTLGTTLRRGAGGKVRELFHGGDLETLALDRAFKLSGGFVLSAADCRRYDFEVQGRGKFGPWELRGGEVVSLVALTPSHLQEYIRRRQALDLAHWLGELYYRLPTPTQTYSLGVEGLAVALGARPAQEALFARVEEWKPRGRRHRLRLSLENSSPEATEIVTLDSNFLEVTVPGGWFESVALGDFERYQLLRKDVDGTLTPTLRRPDILRLYRSILGAGRKVESGIIEVRTPRGSRGAAGPPSLGGRFLLASGRYLEISPAPSAE